MLVFFLRFIVAPLAPGQDPYAILGVDRKASEKDIKTAFRLKTRKFHPDVNHEPDANAKWILISDAYELLSDPKKRARYDQLGIIDESLQDFKKTNNQDKIKTILAQESARRSLSSEKFGEFDRRGRPDVVAELNDESFPIKTNDGRPWLIYVYGDQTDLNQNKKLLEDLFDKTGFLFGIAKVRAQSSPKTVQFLGVRKTPQVVVVDRASGQISHFNGELKLTNLARFAARRFGADVTIVNNDADIVTWRKGNLDRLHVILFSNLNAPPTSYELVAAFLKSSAVFAFASINQRNAVDFPRALGSLTLEELPTYIVYRMGTPRDDTFGGPVTPIVAPMELDAGVLSTLIRKFSFPVFAELHGGNIDRLCPDYCVVWVKGPELADDIKRGINDMNIPTGMINASVETEFVDKFGLEPGDFIVLKRETNQTLVWKEITTWVTFRRNLELMKNGIGKFVTNEYIPPFSVQDVHSKDVSVSTSRVICEKVLNALIPLITWFLGLPGTVILGVFCVCLIVIGELIVLLVKCCFRRVRKEHYE